MNQAIECSCWAPAAARGTACMPCVYIKHPPRASKEHHRVTRPRHPPPRRSDSAVKTCLHLNWALQVPPTLLQHFVIDALKTAQRPRTQPAGVARHGEREKTEAHLKIPLRAEPTARSHARSLGAPGTPSAQLSIGVAVRVRPFTPAETQRLVAEPREPVFAGTGGFQATQPDDTESQARRHAPAGLRRIVRVVDDRMLVFDPPAQSALVAMQRRAFPNTPRGRIRDCRFVFDQLFDELATQEDVYTRTARPLLDSVLDGYNATVFAYGATGCGKTHTILGTPEQPGVVFLAMDELYRKIGLLADTRHVLVLVLFLEIYNETIRDLLAPETPPKALNLREDSAQRIVVAGLLAHTPASVNDVMQLLALGNRNRTLLPTEANAALSRSHAVLQINVLLRARTAALSEEHTFATLLVIDLAGSERAAATRNRGQTLNEGANINKLLLALGNCINALCDPRRGNHVPYRDLKLTRLLKFSLGGNCKTVMIVCVSPLLQHYDETWNTLKYADRAKQIKTKVVRNRHSLDRHVGSYLKMITEQKLEIEELRAREASIVKTAIERLAAEHAACIDAVFDAAASWRSIVSGHHHDVWRKYFLLAKRKFLLLHLQELRRVVGHVQQTLTGTVSHAVRRFVVQAEQLQNKLGEQVICLEQFYDTRQQVDDALAASVSHALSRCMEMPGWGSGLTRIFHEFTALLHQRMQRDVLTESSVLFDYLVGEVGDFAFLAQVLCDTVDASQRYRMGADGPAENTVDDILERASSVLERMNDSDYDLALESAAARFIDARLEIEKDMLQPEPDVVEDYSTLPGGSLHKRQPTSPLRNLRAKRSMRATLQGLGMGSSGSGAISSGSNRPQLDSESLAGASSEAPDSSESSTGLASGGALSSSSALNQGLAEDCDISADDSAFLQRSDVEDSPISNRVNSSMLDFDAMDYAHSPDSPLAKRGPGALADSRAKADFTGFRLPFQTEQEHVFKPLLLNKQASTKVARSCEGGVNTELSDATSEAN